MDKKLKKKWVKALRSGKYKEGKKTCFCCLGVLCDVGRIRSSSQSVIRGRDGEARVLDIYVQNLLANMNDNGKKFSYIASYIEKNL